MLNPDWKARIGSNDLYDFLIDEKSELIHDKYRIVKKIGSGAFSEVHLVHDETDQIRYIIYFLAINFK